MQKYVTCWIELLNTNIYVFCHVEFSFIMYFSWWIKKFPFKVVNRFNWGFEDIFSKFKKARITCYLIRRNFQIRTQSIDYITSDILAAFHFILAKLQKTACFFIVTFFFLVIRQRYQTTAEFRHNRWLISYTKFLITIFKTNNLNPLRVQISWNPKWNIFLIYIEIL